MDKGLLLMTGTSLTDAASYTVTVGTASATIAALIAAAGGSIPAGTAAVLILTSDVVGALYYNPADAASAANANIAGGIYSTPADATALTAMQLIAANAGQSVGIILRKIN